MTNTLDDLIRVTPLQYLKWYLDNAVSEPTFYKSIERYFIAAGCDQVSIDNEWIYIRAGMSDAGMETPQWIRELGNTSTTKMNEVILNVARQIGCCAVDDWRAKIDY